MPTLPRGPDRDEAEWDAIVVGAGHNCLATTALLAPRGFRVLCLEKNAYEVAAALARRAEEAWGRPDDAVDRSAARA